MALFLPILAGVMGGLGLVQTGLQVANARRQTKSQEAFAKFNATEAEIRADQTDAVSRESMNFEIGDIIAARAANGLDPSSPTGRALVRETEEFRGRERGIAVGNERSRATRFRQQAREVAGQRRGILLGGALTAAGQIGQSVAMFSGGFNSRRPSPRSGRAY